MLVDSFQSIAPLVGNLQAQIAAEIANREHRDSLSDLVSIRAMENISTRLAKIDKILKIQRYNLVFIGQVGTGKTTAICHLFGLTREVEKNKGSGANSPKKKTITQVKELLSTGAGKTTICEVVIRPSVYTSIEIDPYEPDEVKQLIDDFGLWIWQKVHPSTIKQRIEIPPNELLRAIRNILLLPELPMEGKIHDRAIEFAQSFDADRYAEFQIQLRDRARLSERGESKIVPTQEDTDLKLWVSQTFQALNVAKIANFSIPKRIYLNLDDTILKLNQYRRLNAIIDNVFSNENIAFPKDNIIFYDALQAYLDDGTLHPYYDREDIDIERERVLAAMEQIITDRERKLTAEIQLLKEQFDRVKSGKDLNKLESDIIMAVKKKISPLSNLDLELDDFSTDYIDLLASLHHMVLRATNNRYGKYELRDIDIYFNGKYLSEKLVRDRTNIYKQEILTAIDWVESEIVDDSRLHPLMQRLRSLINGNYEGLAISLGAEIEELLSDRVFAPQDYEDNEFWQQVIDRWGQGSGYKSDILAEYEEQIQSVSTHLGQSLQLNWQEQIILPILTFLGDEKH
jgi:hypothetical protein